MRVHEEEETEEEEEEKEKQGVGSRTPGAVITTRQ